MDLLSSKKYVRSWKSEEYLKKYKHVKGDKLQRYIYEDLGLLYVAPSIYKSKHFSVSGRSQIDQNTIGVCFNNGIEIQRAVYSRETILRYLAYCKMDAEIRHYDHGIVGGLWLYDCLMKNYNMQYQNEKQRNSNIVFDDFLLDGRLHFWGEQRKIFAYLADCIISHNIWPIEFEENSLMIKVLDERLPFERMVRKVMGLDNWLAVNLYIDTEAKEIEIKY